MTLTLYRGDADKIKEFEYKKTNKYCLLGQGIYLTDNLRVANTYRTKGSYTTAVHNLFHGEAENRNEAFEKAFPTFCERMWVSEHGYRNHYRRASDSDRKRHEQNCRPLYQKLIESKDITADYTATPVLASSRYLKPSQVIAHNKETLKKAKRYIEVKWQEIPNPGYVTRFEFEETKFNPFVFNVDRACNDDFFWTLMYDEKLMIGELADNVEDYIRLNKGRKVFDAVNIPVDPDKRLTMKMRIAKRGTKDLWRRISHILQPYGFVGYEYNGGQRLGGGYHHRAFCLWDEDFVNTHKVLRFK